MQEQRNDPYLKELIVVPAPEIASAANGYFLFNELLFRKWVPEGEDTVKGGVFQLVVPDKICPLVLRVDILGCGKRTWASLNIFLAASQT